MNNLLDYAKRELDLLGMTDEASKEGGDTINLDMRKHILEMVDLFSKEGHSGMSATYAVAILKDLLSYTPLTPLTGADDEWVEVSNEMGVALYQNKRCSTVFKQNDKAYDIDGKVFFEWHQGECGPFKTYYTSGDSKVDVTFPYTPTTIYEERNSNANISL